MYTQIRQRKLEGGKVKLYLDTIYNGYRQTETLPHVFLEHPKTPADRQDKRDAEEFAKAMRNKKDMELRENEYGIDEVAKKHYDFFKFAEDYIRQNQHVDIRLYIAVINKFKEFVGKNQLPCSQVSEVLLERFNSFLLVKHNGETPMNYIKKLKQIIKAAYKERYFKINPAENIKAKRKPSDQKEVLSLAEIKKLFETKCTHPIVKNAFLFSCLTGVRFCDVMSIKGKNVRDGRLMFTQSKTKIAINNPISDDAQKLIPQSISDEAFAFLLPSHTTCLEVLRNWTKNAGINKKITWHCARHSFGTNLVALGNDVAITSEFLGHNSLTYTKRYVRIHDDLKVKALNKIPSIM